ncbi:MAG: RNA polymerase sigma-70 factor [Mangrovibacterium sp.]
MNFQNAHIDLREDNQKVFEKIYLYYTPRLKAFLSQYIAQEDEAEGLVHDCFVELWERRADFQENTNINAWLYTVAKNKALKLLAKESTKQRYVDREKSLEISIQLDALSQLSERSFDDGYIRSRVMTSLGRLSESVRNVFLKQRFEGKTNKEVAAELAISVKTVEAHTTKALKQLRNDLKDLG